MLLQVFIPRSVRGRDGTFASFSPLGKGHESAATLSEPVLLLLEGTSGVCASRGGREGSGAGLICSVLNSGSPGTSLAVAFTCTAVPYIILSCSLNVRVGCS